MPANQPVPVAFSLTEWFVEEDGHVVECVLVLAGGRRVAAEGSVVVASFVSRLRFTASNWSGMDRAEAKAILNGDRETAVALLLRAGELIEANGRLEARVSELEQRLNRNSRNSSLPPSPETLARQPIRNRRAYDRAAPLSLPNLPPASPLAKHLAAIALGDPMPSLV